MKAPRAMSEARAQRMLRWAAVLTLVALGFMLWSLLVPTALPVVLAMSVGQGLGTLAFAMFGWVVLSDLRTKRATARQGEGDGAGDGAGGGQTGSQGAARGEGGPASSGDRT